MGSTTAHFQTAIGRLAPVGASHDEMKSKGEGETGRGVSSITPAAVWAPTSAKDTRGQAPTVCLVA